MSRAFMWIALIVVSLVFFLGLLTLAKNVPLLAVLVAGVVGYALVAVANEAREL